jgi:hypothetical protein
VGARADRRRGRAGSGCVRVDAVSHRYLRHGIDFVWIAGPRGASRKGRPPPDKPAYRPTSRSSIVRENSPAASEVEIWGMPGYRGRPTPWATILLVTRLVAPRNMPNLTVSESCLYCPHLDKFQSNCSHPLNQSIIRAMDDDPVDCPVFSEIRLTEMCGLEDRIQDDLSWSGDNREK